MERNLGATIFVAGHQGMVGSAILRQLTSLGYRNVITRSKSELDLLDQRAVFDFFANHRIDYVYLAAAKVGGIYANNTYPAAFIYENLMIEANIIHACHLADVQHCLFLGSSCIYPKNAEQPMQEVSLLTGALESTNEPYAIAKIAGIKLCESYNRQYGRNYRSIMPTNLYGPHDNFHVQNAHVIPALINRIQQAKEEQADELVVWGTGNVRREFLHVDDMASASVFLMELNDDQYKKKIHAMCSHINVGSGIDCTIKELSDLLVNIIGYQGRIVYDASKPEGPARKLLDVSRLQALGWSSSISLEDGLQNTYTWYLKHQTACRQS